MLTKLNWSLEPNDNNKEKEKEDDKIFLGKKEILKNMNLVDGE